MVKPIPDQVVLRSYIATLRSAIVEYEEEKLNANSTDPQAHYHGDVKCTADHGHVDTEHADHHAHEHHEDKHDHREHEHHEHKHTEHCGHNHDHKEKHHDNDHDDHREHMHTEHKHDHAEKHEDGHKHTEHCEHNDKHDHDHDASKDHHHNHDHVKTSEHDHSHDDRIESDTVPAWKKAALSADPTAAPFGGSWNAESNISASDEPKNESNVPSGAMEE